MYYCNIFASYLFYHLKCSDFLASCQGFCEFIKQEIQKTNFSQLLHFSEDPCSYVSACHVIDNTIFQN